MTENSLHFELPSSLSVKKFISKLNKQADLQIVTQQYTIKTFYDSFDWRLYRADMVCEFNHSQVISQLELTHFKKRQMIARLDTAHVPAFSKIFPDGAFKQHIEPLLDMRALLPLCDLPYEAYQINILNNDQKTILRLQIDEYEFLNNRVQLKPLKGYDKALQKFTRLLQDKFEVSASSCTSVLNEALKQQGRKPKDYSSKVAIKLKPDMRADKASKLIYKHLLQALKINEAGTIADIDSEFLHDFRVAARRTRSGFSRIKNTLPTEVISKHACFFAWLGQITGTTRDLDVYLLSYPKYKEILPITLRDEITPLYDFLVKKQKHAQQELAEKLKSSEYNKQLLAWEEYLNEPLPKKATASQSQPILKLTNQRIWKVYQRILKEGEAIDDSSPAVALHDLRKTCKKLRYLMEFFQSLYPEAEIKHVIRSLKGFQSVLGDFQDYEIQELSIKRFSEEMMQDNVPSNTLLAMGVLVQHLDHKKCDARNHFAEQFSLFVETKNKTVFKQLFTQKV